jgi:hypothetical protein
LNILEVLQVSKEIDILLRSESYNYQVWKIQENVYREVHF